MTMRVDTNTRCHRCGATTIDFPVDLRTSLPSQPCRTCRRETQRARDFARRDPPLCSHHRCTRYLRSKERFCHEHRPRFGA